ncbi:MAG: hypothetical protein J0M10_11235 [Chitinophagales bacterium]|nr:hypothetical protein [Chitinophagales bacterium]
MRYLNKLLFYILLFSIFHEANAQQDEGCKYLAVVSYIRTNYAVNDKIKLFFPHAAKKKQLFVEVGLYEKISFLNISGFEVRLKEKKYILDEKIITNPNLYYDKYYFTPYISSFLEQVKWQSESKLFLSFSKPIDNYLIAEITDFNPGKYGGSKFGKGMKMFIKFNTMGLVEDILYTGAIFN